MAHNKQANKRELVGLIDSILQDIEKSAEANTEAGGYTGASTHPSAKVEDGTQTAETGARAAENESDNKAEPNRGKTVDATSEGPGAGQDSVQMNVGITSKATGEDSAAETSSAKGGKEDSDSTHPARTDNSELAGGKYASDMERLEALAKQATELGAQLVAAIATQADSEIKQAGQPAPAAKVAADVSSITANQDIPAEDKQAVDAMVVSTLEDVIGTAFRRAEKAAAFFQAFAAKRAEDEECEEEEGSEEESGKSDPPPAAAGEGAPPAAEGGGGAPGEADIAAMLGGGEGMGAGGAAAAMGGDAGAPPEVPGAPPAPGPDAGMDPMAAAGGGGMDPAAGGGVGAPDIEQLIQILTELGITPEQLEAAISGKQAAAKEQQKLAAMKNMIKELVGRSR
jgi:hypothetical protein